MFMVYLSFNGRGYFRNGFMGTLPNAILGASQVNNWVHDSVDATKLLEIDYSLSTSNRLQCIIWKIDGFDSDLNSRWINSIASVRSTNQECFSVYWNSNLLNDSQIFERAAKFRENYVYVTSSPEIYNGKIPIPANFTSPIYLSAK